MVCRKSTSQILQHIELIGIKADPTRSTDSGDSERSRHRQYSSIRFAHRESNNSRGYLESRSVTISGRGDGYKQQDDDGPGKNGSISHIVLRASNRFDLTEYEYICCMHYRVPRSTRRCVTPGHADLHASRPCRHVVRGAGRNLASGRRRSRVAITGLTVVPRLLPQVGEWHGHSNDQQQNIIFSLRDHTAAVKRVSGDAAMSANLTGIAGGQPVWAESARLREPVNHGFRARRCRTARPGAGRGTSR